MRVEKWHGAGNDFVVVDGRETALPGDGAAWARAACDRRRGIGADGVLVLEPDASTDFRMRYRNADGGEAEMCGNGGRVLAAFAVAHGLGRGGHVRFLSRWGVHDAQVEERGRDLYRVRLTLPDVPLPEVVGIDAPWGKSHGVLVRCGVPHLVVALADTPAADLEAVEVEAWGALLRRDPALGPEGANVDFVARSGEGTLAVRTFERGVEGETLACGTGATATAAAAVRLANAGSPVTVVPRSGEALEVSFRRTAAGLTEVVLRGPAARVFRGEFEPPLPV